jgi:hypothetical protein
VLISCNWTIFIYCVSTNQLVEASFGYYLTPLLSIALGVFLFGERMSRVGSWACARGGAVGVQASSLGTFPGSARRWRCLSASTAISANCAGRFAGRAAGRDADPVSVHARAWAFWGGKAHGAFPSPIWARTRF